jgi:hypothetical protein
MSDDAQRFTVPIQLILPVSLEVATTAARNFEQVVLLFHERGQKTRLVRTGLVPRSG